MPNALATLALVLWPVVSVVLFLRLPPGRALVVSIVVAYLVLPPPPAGFDFPLMPPLTKENIPSIVAALTCLVLYRPQLRILPESRVGLVLVVLFVVSPLFTVLSNPEPVFYGRIGLPGLRLFEAVSMMIQQAILVSPLLMARNLLRDEEGQRDVLLALAVGGLVYSLPMLVEVRLSPQLNIWIYGYFQHNFDQMMRGDGFRPIVFLYHGLWVAFFTMTAVVAALALARGNALGRGGLFWAAGGWLFVVLVLCKSLASLLYATALAPVVSLLSRRMQLHVAMLLAALALGYPVLKGLDLVPKEAILSYAESIDPVRANSLRFRFDNETILMERAYEKPVFGWGLWGRNHILDENTGAILTVTDGRWIILIGVLGWAGFLAEFGLLFLPVFLLWWRALRSDSSMLTPWAAPLALILAINAVDMIPNATLTPLTWLVAGALLGYAELMAASVARPGRRHIRTVL